jgi:hypothetical protein
LLLVEEDAENDGEDEAEELPEAGRYSNFAVVQMVGPNAPQVAFTM